MGPRVNHNRLTLHLLRHGETELSREDRFCGAIDADLTDAGRRMAQAFTACWARHLTRPAWRAIYTSERRRTIETAAPFASAIGLSPIVDRGLDEINYGSWQGRTKEEIARDEPMALRRWLADPTVGAPAASRRTTSRAAPARCWRASRRPTPRRRRGRYLDRRAQDLAAPAGLPADRRRAAALPRTDPAAGRRAQRAGARRPGLVVAAARRSIAPAAGAERAVSAGCGDGAHVQPRSARAPSRSFPCWPPWSRRRWSRRSLNVAATAGRDFVGEQQAGGGQAQVSSSTTSHPARWQRSIATSRRSVGSRP